MNEEHDHRGSRDRGEGYAPAPRDVRLYIGHGNRQGFNEQKFVDLLAKHCDLPADKMRRFSLRDCYAFADFGAELADSVCEKLNAVPVDGDGKFFIRRAIALGSQREEGGRRGGGRGDSRRHHDENEHESGGEFDEGAPSRDEFDSFDEQDEMSER
jgi:hypothetical protein